jgi:hypothetical protein
LYGPRIEERFPVHLRSNKSEHIPGTKSVLFVVNRQKAYAEPETHGRAVLWLPRVRESRRRDAANCGMDAGERTFEKTLSQTVDNRMMANV